MTWENVFRYGLEQVAWLFGLVPYELYVLPGMFIALITMLVYNTFDPVQLHLLPHWFAYSMGQYIKMHFKQKRPGCVLDEEASVAATKKYFDKLDEEWKKNSGKKIPKPIQSGKVIQNMVQNIKGLVGQRSMISSQDELNEFKNKYTFRPTESKNWWETWWFTPQKPRQSSVGSTQPTRYFVQKYRKDTKDDKNKISDNHCEGKTAVQSFPSGHTLIAFALVTSLVYYLYDPLVEDKQKVFLKIPFYNKNIRYATTVIAFFVAAMVSVHRVLYRYHSILDVSAGAIIGFAIGFTSYHVCNTVRRACQTYTSKMPPLGRTENYIFQAIRYIGIGICAWGLLVSVLYDMPKVSQNLH